MKIAGLRAKRCFAVVGCWLLVVGKGIEDSRGAQLRNIIEIKKRIFL